MKEEEKEEEEEEKVEVERKEKVKADHWGAAGGLGELEVARRAKFDLRRKRRTGKGASSRLVSLGVKYSDR